MVEMSIKHSIMFLFVVLISSVSHSQEGAVIEPPEVEDSEVQSLDEALNREDVNSRAVIEKPQNVDLKNRVSYEEVRNNTPYDDLAVIQKIYMPKTNRFSGYLGLGLIPNDVFYRTGSLSAKLGYYFTEKFGAEFHYSQFDSSATSEIKNLSSRQGLTVENVVTMKSYYGAQLYYNSMYGKLALLNRNIVPFELYQVIGIGQIQTNQKRSEMAFNVGFGQIFNMSRNYGIRWGLDLMFFNGKDEFGNSQQFSYYFLNFGWTGLFPGVASR